MSHNILIISFHFPPSPSIGGRRWAKFVKYLSREKEVHATVISSVYKGQGKVSPYTKDVKDAHFTHIEVSSRYPAYLQNMQYVKKSKFSGLIFRLLRFYLVVFAKGNYYDYTIFWKKYFRKMIPEIIVKNKINRVIFTGHPYRYALYALELKKIAGVEVILDCRDFWWDLHFIPPVSKKRQKFEIESEKKVIESVDKILSVSEAQMNILKARHPKHAPMYVLRNGFDREDIPTDLVQKNIDKNCIRFVHLGAMHAEKEYYWKPLVKALSKLKSSHRVLFDKLVFDFVGICPAVIITSLKEIDVKVNPYGFVDLESSYRYLNQADIALWFKYDGYSGEFATKFSDYVSMNKYMWLFSEKGDVTMHVESNKIGNVFYREDDKIERTIYEKLIQLEDIETRTFNRSYDASALDIEFLTKQLLELLYTKTNP